MDERIPPLNIKIMFESSPPKSRVLGAAEGGKKGSKKGVEGAKGGKRGPRCIILYV